MRGRKGGERGWGGREGEERESGGSEDRGRSSGGSGKYTRGCGRVIYMGLCGREGEGTGKRIVGRNTVMDEDRGGTSGADRRKRRGGSTERDAGGRDEEGSQSADRRKG